MESTRERARKPVIFFFCATGDDSVRKYEATLVGFPFISTEDRMYEAPPPALSARTSIVIFSPVVTFCMHLLSNQSPSTYLVARNW